MLKRLEDMTEPELRMLCNTSAKAVELAAEALEVEKPLFVLVLFNDPAIGQYVSNCNRKDMIKALMETAYRLSKGEDVTR